MVAMLMQFNPASFDWVETAGIVLMLVVVGSAFLFGLLRGIIVLGSTCDLLLEAEREKTKIAQAESIQARKDLARVADEFNHNLERVLTALLNRSSDG
jgi:ABC-type branched-subunit amino acid transport system permease subunit